MARLYDSGLRESGVLRPDARPEEKELLDRLQRWANRQDLGRVPTPHKDQLIADMAAEDAKTEYGWLSGYVHASAVTITIAHQSAVSGHRHRKTEAWLHAFYATDLSLAAVDRLCGLWKGEHPELQQIGLLRQHYINQFNSAFSASWL